MSSPTNEDRADFAEQSIYVFERTTGSTLKDGTAIKDLICDLCHLCRRYGLDPHVEVEAAVAMFHTEEAEDPPIVVTRLP